MKIYKIANTSGGFRVKVEFLPAKNEFNVEIIDAEGAPVKCTAQNHEVHKRIIDRIRQKLGGGGDVRLIPEHFQRAEEQPEGYYDQASPFQQKETEDFDPFKDMNKTQKERVGGEFSF